MSSTMTKKNPHLGGKENLEKNFHMPNTGCILTMRWWVIFNSFYLSFSSVLLNHLMIMWKQFKFVLKIVLNAGKTRIAFDFLLKQERSGCVPEAGAGGKFVQNVKKCIELTRAQPVRQESCQIKEEHVNGWPLRDLGTRHEVTEKCKWQVRQPAPLQRWENLLHGGTFHPSTGQLSRHKHCAWRKA